jgi:hypothetical protein
MDLLSRRSKSKVNSLVSFPSFIACTLVLIPAIAATPSSEPDVELYQSFLHHHLAVIDRIERLKASSSAESAKALEAGVAARYGVDAPSFARISAVEKVFKKELSDLAASRIAYLEPYLTPTKMPDPEQMVRFEHKRKEILTSTIVRLKAHLPAESWQSLLNYLKSTLSKQTVSSSALAPPKSK